MLLPPFHTTDPNVWGVYADWCEDQIGKDPTKIHYWQKRATQVKLIAKGLVKYPKLFLWYDQYNLFCSDTFRVNQKYLESCSDYYKSHYGGSNGERYHWVFPETLALYYAQFIPNPLTIPTKDMVKPQDLCWLPKLTVARFFVLIAKHLRYPAECWEIVYRSHEGTHYERLKPGSTPIQ